MTTVTAEYQTDFQQAFESRNNGGNPDWLRAVRQAGFERFTKLGFPTRKDEEWKYTSVKPIQQGRFSLVSEAAEVDPAAYQAVLSPDYLEIVFVNGVFSPRLSRLQNLPAGVKVQPLSQAAAEHPDEIQMVLSEIFEGHENAFTGLNTALMQDGTFVHVDDNAVCERVINLVYLFTDKHPDAMTFPRNVIKVGSAAKVSILQSFYCRDPKLAYFNNAMTDMAIGANAFVEYNCIQADSLAAYHVHNTRIHQAEGSRLESFCMTTGGQLVRNNLVILLDGPNVHATLDGLYAMRRTQHVDNHTAVDHRFPDCTSSQLYKGILDGRSRAVFNGKIFVRQIAQKTNAYQLNRNLLLSPDAEADTKPQLEIFADDVRCTHGATVGQVNEDELFYLQSRCIPRREAIDILSHGFAEDVLSHIPSETVQNKMRRLLNDYFLDAYREHHDSGSK